VELDTAPDQTGAPFALRVNGEPFLVRGANWIPDHAFPTEVGRARYGARLTDATEANVNLLRVWGGGIYESEDFYEACDQRGILVWQDFLFACAAYAEEPCLAGEVAAEAEEAIARLCPHPSLAVWNGNNENVWGHADWGWQPLLGGRTWGDGYYRELLPALVASLDPTRPYSPASPYSFADGVHPNDPLHGTMHVWDVWTERDYTAYRDHKARFVTEFGFQGPPSWATLTSYVHDDPLDPEGPQMLAHQKAEDGAGKLARGMAGHLPQPQSTEDWHWAAQLNQAQAVRVGVEHFRSLTPFNTGVVVWQLNDCWPAISWSMVDWEGRRKPVWHALKAAYAPRLATIQPRAGGLSLIVVNDSRDPWEGWFDVSRRSFGGAIHASDAVRIRCDPFSAGAAGLAPAVATAEDVTREVVVATPRGGAGSPVRAVWNFAEVERQQLAARAFEARAERTATGCRVAVAARSYLRDLTLQADRVDPAASAESGMVTLLPGESHVFDVAAPAHCEPAAFLDPVVLRSANDLAARRLGPRPGRRVAPHQDASIPKRDMRDRGTP
jgi:beta-mannosidase